MTSFSQWGNELYSGERSYNIVGHAKQFLGLGLALMIASLAILGIQGLNPSIEFSGGTQFIITDTQRTEQQIAYDVLAEDGITENVRVSALGSDSIRVQTQSLDTSTTIALRDDLASAYEVSPEDVQTNSVGATWSQDVTKKALQSIVIFVVLVSVVMTIYFRSWTMSAAALIALAHDLVITVGFFALTQVEVSPATVIGFLTILGYSLYDTVVVFDRVREMTAKWKMQDKYTYSELVNLGVNQTLVRSINTSVVAILPVGSILFIGSFLLGAGTLTDISLALFIGIFVGAFSSVFIASPALSVLAQLRKETAEHRDEVLAKRGVEVEGGPVPEKVKVSVSKTPGRHLGQQAQPKRKRRKKS